MIKKEDKRMHQSQLVQIIKQKRIENKIAGLSVGVTDQKEAVFAGIPL